MVCGLEDRKLDYDAFILTFHGQLKSSMYTCYVYEEDGTIMGMANIRIESQLHHERKVCEIMELYVKEEFRNRKIGKQLLDKVKEKAREEDCERVELSSSNWRKDSHRFYMDNGFDMSHVNLTCDL